MLRGLSDLPQVTGPVSSLAGSPTVLPRGLLLALPTWPFTIPTDPLGVELQPQAAGLAGGGVCERVLAGHLCIWGGGVLHVCSG